MSQQLLGSPMATHHAWIRLGRQQSTSPACDDKDGLQRLLWQPQGHCNAALSVIAKAPTHQAEASLERLLICFQLKVAKASALAGLQRAAWL